jgi:hypothetical protein
MANGKDSLRHSDSVPNIARRTMLLTGSGLAAMLLATKARATRVAVDPTKPSALKIFDVSDYATPQAAIDAAGASGGGIVFFPPGIYSLPPLPAGADDRQGRGLFNASKNVSLLGSGSSSVLRASGAVGSYRDTLILFDGTGEAGNEANPAPSRCTDFFIRDLVIDLNKKGAWDQVLTCLTCIDCERFEIAGCHIKGYEVGNSGSGNPFEMGCALAGAVDFTVQECIFERESTVNYDNGGITVGNDTAPYNGRISKRGSIRKNHFVRANIGIKASYIEVSENVVERAGSGGGIVISNEQDPTLFYATSHCSVVNNTLHSGGDGHLVLDVNGTAIHGVENWGRYSLIHGNLIACNEGAAIDVLGKACLISNNICVNNCTYFANGNGIIGTINTLCELDFFPEKAHASEHTGAYSLFSGNTCLDNRVPSTAKGQAFGYGDTPSVTGVQVVANNFIDCRVGMANVSGSATRFIGDTFDLRVDWPLNSVANGAVVGINVVSPMAAIGDFALATIDSGTQDCMLSANCNTNGIVRVTLCNRTGSALSFGSVSLRVRLYKQSGALGLPPQTQPLTGCVFAV